MTSIIVQPCSSRESRQHYEDTITKPVVFADHATLIPATDLAGLKDRFESGAAAMWGVVPGIGNHNRPRYQRVQVGDVAMFSRDSGFFSCGTVAWLMHNPGLAEALWGRKSDGQTWEYMYVLDEMRPLEIPYSEFNPAAGYSLNYPHQGFNVLKEPQSRAVLERFPLASERYIPDSTADQYEAAVAGLTGDLDRRMQAYQRTEQAYLRKLLFPALHAACDLCGRTFEIEFLVAAHIKKRAACTDDEKRDASHIVMSACKFGCDELFERGYISVGSDGTILLSEALPPGSHARAYVSEQLAGKTLMRPMAGREDYFAWHRTRSFRG